MDIFTINLIHSNRVLKDHDTCRCTFIIRVIVLLIVLKRSYGQDGYVIEIFKCMFLQFIFIVHVDEKLIFC
jgi:hypothetical protein